ncbi:hypothetical protein LCGC14_0619500 [marine sediment metagenome]|uniref:Uncharacterized protein n=1 Tax=marine sediment metagenome TaxID=412755 RepID=A0A0F9UDV4_9ZZZZ
MDAVTEQFREECREREGALRVFLANLKTLHQRIMMRYLRKRGWVVFYLEEKHRKKCSNATCWMNLYN